MYLRFTDRARKVMQLANQEAQHRDHEYIGTEHMLLGLVKEGSGVAAQVLKNLDIDLRKIRLEVEKIVPTGPGGEQVVMGKLPHTPRARKAIEYSVEEARKLNHNYVGTEHLLLGLLREQEGVAAQVLLNLGLKLEDVREEVLKLLGHNLPDAARMSSLQSAASAETPILDALCRPMQPRKGERPQVSRPDAIARLALAARRLSSAFIILIEETLTHTPSVMEEFAAYLVTQPLAGRSRDRVAAVDTESLAADAVESPSLNVRKIRQILREAGDGRAILYVNHFERVLESGRTQPFALLNPARSTPCCLIVGRTTPDTWQRACRRFPGIEGRVEVIRVEPLTADEVVTVLKDRRPGYESHHNAQITDSAIQDAVTLCLNHPAAGALLDRALLLIDTACAWRRLKPGIEGRERMNLQLESRIELLNRDKEAAVADADFERAARIRDQAEQLKRELDGVLKAWREILSERIVLDGASVKEAFHYTGAIASPDIPLVGPA